MPSTNFVVPSPNCPTELSPPQQYTLPSLIAQEWSRFVATKLTPVSSPCIGPGGRLRTGFPGRFPRGPAKLFPQHFNPSESTPHAKCCASSPVAESERISPFNPTTSCTTNFERFSSG